MRAPKLAVMILLLAGVAAAQQRNGGAAGGPPTGSTPNTGSVNPRAPSITTPPGNNVPEQRPIFISGKVALSDGTAPPDLVKIERVCNGTPRVEGRTDRKGRFSFELGRSLEFQDASSNGQDGFGIGGGGFGAPRGPGFGSSSSIRERDLFGCELRASLPGYRSDSVTLANIHYMDNPDI